ncbi:unnamed protein product [Closterium sp. NIES-53]
MATSPDFSSTVVRRHWTVYTPSPAAARARPTPRPHMPQSSPAASGSTEDEPSSNADRPRPPLPRVAVPTFPQRNRPQGQVKRNADAEPPSPRHRMTKRVRHSYTAKEKLHWLKMQEFQPDLSNRALAKLAKPPAETVLRWIDESWEAVPDELVKKAFVTCGISTSIDGTEDHLILAHMRDKGEVEVLDDVNEMVDDETVVNPFYAEVPMPAEELQVEEEDDAAEAEAEAEDEEGVGLADGEEAGECSDDDDWWRPGRFDGEEIEEWHAGDDDE